MLRVGLTGGIACGKTRVLQRLAARGCRTLDLDHAAREVVRPGSAALAEIEAAFGASVLRDGALDRAALAALVFGDASARARLDAIVHPRVWALESRWAAAQPEDVVRVVDAALLVETGAHLRFDRLVVVHCDPRLQLARLRARDGLDEAAARARIEAQMPLAEKRGFANLQIDSSGSPADTDRAADALADTLVGVAAERPADHDASLDRFVGGLLYGSHDGPRGLTPERVLAAADPERGIAMPTLASALVPPAMGPWYRAAEGEPALPASRLGVAIAAWAHCRRAADVELSMAAAASVARLVHVDPRPRTDACVVAGVAARLVGATSVGRPTQLAAELARRGGLLGGGEPSGRLEAVWAALEQHPLQPDAAGSLAASRGGDAGTAAALAGLAVRFPESDRSAALRGALVALSADAPRRPCPS